MHAHKQQLYNIQAQIVINADGSIVFSGKTCNNSTNQIMAENERNIVQL